MDPLTLALLVYGASLVVAFVAATIDELVNWFRNRHAIKDTNKDVVAFTLAGMINGKKYLEVPGVFTGTASTRIVQGFYDQKKNEIVEARMVKSNKPADEAVVRMHDQRALVVYN